MNMKKVACLSVFSLAILNGTAYASVCQTENYMVTGQAYHGNVTCSQGTIPGLNVDGNVTLNGTTVLGEVTIRGKLTADNSTLKDDITVGSLAAQNTTFEENVVSNGAVYLAQSSVIAGDLTAGSDQVTIDSTSSVKGKVLNTH